MKTSSSSLRFLSSFLLFIFISTPFLQAVAYAEEAINYRGSTSIEEEAHTTPPPTYPELMRRFRALQAPAESRQGGIAGQGGESDQESLLADLTSFLKAEKERMDTLHVSYFKQQAYTRMLRTQIRALGGTPAIWDKIRVFFEDLFGIEPEEGVKMILDEAKDSRPEEPKLPKNPSSFQFPKEPPAIQAITHLETAPDDTGSPKPTNIFENIENIITIEEVGAATSTPSIPYESLPTLQDTQEDGKEVLIPQEIQDLASELHYNPVEIFSFLRNSITYAPYYGARKGPLGCLKDLLCNDTDASSLAISLFRASGIPARYKKSIVVVPVSQLKSLLGVDETKTAYAAFALNNVPVFTMSGNEIGTNFDTADFSNETKLALEWTHLQIFYEYDEQGGNISNGLSFASASSTDDVRTTLQQYPKKQWIPLDVVMRPYTRTTREIVHDTAGFNTDSFWSGFFGYQGTLSPVSKYTQDLISQTGKDIHSPTYQSSRTLQPFPFEILPNTLPYVIQQGVTGGTTILPETWSSLPDARRAHVTISLLHENRSTSLSHTFYASEIENKGIELVYEGKTQTDKDTIQSYGGIHATPSALVDIAPVFEVGGARYTGTDSLKIGESMILNFSYGTGAETLSTDEKFSVAGNSEGIFMTFSRVRPNPLLDTPSKVLLAGNTEIARKYLEHIQEQGDLLSKSLDYAYQTSFARAVVTQNRILSTIGGMPTTFDFKGLTIDASSYITDYSNRDTYKTHQKDFRLLWGLDASYYEGQLFTDLAGLEGISTVKGLQYASSRPNDYTIHTITSANESVIDTLLLSPNTKANMHTDVQAGKTIVTPDKPVEHGTWRGIFYTSISPDGFGTYAIGEQTAGVLNGGWTTNQYTITQWTGEDAYEHFAYESTNEPKQFIYKDNSEKNILCVMDVARYNFIVGGQVAPGWNLAQHGKPCAEDLLWFGSHDHQLIIATDGAYFESQSDRYGPGGEFGYWTRNATLVNTFQQKFPSRTISIGKLYPYWGTYIYDIMDQKFFGLVGKLERKGIIMYSPKERQFYEIRGRMFKEYTGDKKVLDDYIPGLLGHPTSEEIEIPNFDNSFYPNYKQTFTNGALYRAIGGLLFPDDVYPVIGAIYQKHNELGGVSAFGLPARDPAWSAEQQNTILQTFENGKRLKYTIGGAVLVEDASQTLSINRDFQGIEWEEFQEGIFDALAEVDIYSITINFAAGQGVGLVMNQAAKSIAKKAGMKGAVTLGAKFVPYLGWTFFGVTASLAARENRPLYLACNSDPQSLIENKRPAYYCGKLGVSGLAFAVGIATEAAAERLNLLGVATKAARAGKAKLFGKTGENEALAREIRDLLEKNPKTRTALSEIAEGLDDVDVDLLASNKKILSGLAAGKSLQTFNGFVQSGPMKGYAKYRVAPRYAHEVSEYTKPLAFDHKALIKIGALEPDGTFYSIDQLDTATKKALDLGSDLAEIVYIKKIDGTTLFAPRATNYKLPHAYMARGEDVVAAGTLEVFGTKESPFLVITDTTGHYEVMKESAMIVEAEIKRLGYAVQPDYGRYVR